MKGSPFASPPPPSAVSEAAASREANNESRYRSLFSDLLKKRKDAAGDVTGAGPNLYAGEAKVIQKAVQAETMAIVSGIAVGAAVSLSVRYLPTYLVGKIGGEAKARALREAEEASRKAKGAGLRRGFGLLLEASFGFWAGWRGYNMASSRTDGTYETIAELPLVSGRSGISDSLCAEWTETAYRRVPPAFWKNLDMSRAGESASIDGYGGKLKDPRTWTAIRAFADNCLKRDAYERKLRKEWGLADGEPVSIPIPGVPAETVPSWATSTEVMTRETAGGLVEDAS